jgi:aminoglycoside phosphotransferase (APT) family kinase protein
MDTDPKTEIVEALRGQDLIADGDQFAIGPLSGGVSCDVFLVEVKRRPPVVVKRALPKLRVAADWRAPVERSESEVAWLRLVAELDQRLVPRVIFEDRARHLFVMEYLPKEEFPVWKDELAAGLVDVAFASSVGAWLANIHASTASSPSLAQRFANQEQFMSLRLDAYLLEAARVNADVAAKLRSLANCVAVSQIALMQGDISPKNILHGPDTPVFLDAETTCYGDPAFDLAFCLNHLLLKSVWHPEHATAYASAFVALKNSYLRGVGWEPVGMLERRTAALLPGLLLARIDGKSPVEYITNVNNRAFVRARAKEFLKTECCELEEMCGEWLREVERYFTASGTR